jgi:hypothetical protein
MTGSAFCAPQHEDCCLEDLPPSIRRYHYQGWHHFCRVLYLEDENQPEDILSQIDSADLQRDFLDPITTYFPRLRLSFDIPHGYYSSDCASIAHAAAIGVLTSGVSRTSGFMGFKLAGAIK